MELRAKYTCLIAALALIVSCDIPQEDVHFTRTHSALPQEEHCTELLFSDTSLPGGKTGWRFLASEPSLVTEGGHALWRIQSMANSTEEACVTAARQSGSPVAGFGLVYFYRTAQGKEYLLALLINTMGQYAIAKYAGGEFTQIQGWSYSPRLKTGYGAQNKISVSYNVPTRMFTLSLNGVAECTFLDGTKPRLTTGKSGAIVCLSPSEHFPDEPSSVLFEP